jgi:hypothetical protein
MSAKRKKPSSDEPPVAPDIARKAARKMLAPALAAWGSTQRVHVYYIQDDCPVDGYNKADRIVIMRGDQHVAMFPTDIAPEDFRSAEQLQQLIKVLVGLIEEQAMIAEFTHPFAEFDVNTSREKAIGAAKGGRVTAKPTRDTIERLMRNHIDRGETDVSHYYPEWSTAYGYTPRHLRNIWKAVWAARTVRPKK